MNAKQTKIEIIILVYLGYCYESKYVRHGYVALNVYFITFVFSL